MACASSTPRVRNSTRICTRPCSRCTTKTWPAGTVAQVVEEGYAIGERVLRPAKVGVAKGGAKPN